MSKERKEGTEGGRKRWVCSERGVKKRKGGRSKQTKEEEWCRQKKVVKERDRDREGNRDRGRQKESPRSRTDLDVR